jgi:hypothetical protein
MAHFMIVIITLTLFMEFFPGILVLNNIKSGVRPCVK